MKANVGLALTLLGFIGGLLGLVEVEFECFPSLLWGFIFNLPPDVIGKDFGIGKFNHADINELG